MPVTPNEPAVFAALLREALVALDLPPALAGRLVVTGDDVLPSCYAVTTLATAAIGTAGLAVAALTGTAGPVAVDRHLANAWFRWSIKPLGWALPAVWDVIAGDYPAADGWIRLHTNAPRHRDAALAVLGCPAERARVAAAVAAWRADDLEQAVVAAGGCAAAMRGTAAWAAHPQGRAVAAEPLVALALHEPATPPRWRPDGPRPLAGIRVLDLTRVLAGPVATRFLAGLGAAVLRLDPPGWDEPAVVPDVILGKRCARLDLRDPAGREQFRALLASADVLVHGYRPGALAALGFGDEERRAVNPGLVDVSLSAYGHSGPWAGRRGFDSLVQMSAGIAAAGQRWQGLAQPVPLPVQALDHATGYLMAAAALRGLLARRTTGQGLSARLSLARTALALPVLQVPGRPFAGAADEDYAETVEKTPWGPALRLKPPVAIGGITLASDLPAAALGSAPPAWS
ncbi:CoA transferase [Zavarzinia compransoris]|uniref:Acyl-CoA transferase n=1 Tax=Zavarzinia compransoris TaxID=1264899 RepID=A0A317EAX3_9PROT|nr:CoA transferase [Zavarzinia compransoris]PWR23434.1 acyl-CoA transferase [Zavarzinia compransoris]TDP45989.1 CoA transferase family III [Zavarzinia compransoris]